MSDYVTEDQLRAFSHEFDSLDDANAVATLLTAASRLFDNLTGVAENFYQAAPSPAAYTTRVYYGNGTGYLPVDPYTALNPINPIVVDAANAYDVPPYTERDGMLIVYGSYISRFSGWNDGVSVTVSANWGFTEIPADVQLATAHLAIHLWRTADPANAIIAGAEGAAARIETIPKVARDIVNAYRAKYWPGFAFA